MTTPTATARLEALRAVPLFSDLPDRSLKRILNIATEFDVQAGHVLVQPGLEGSGFFVIEEGTVVVEVGGKAWEHGPGEFFGELALLTPEAVRTARVRAKTAMRGLAIGRYDFRTMLEREPKIALHMLEAVAERLAEMVRG